MDTEFSWTQGPPETNSIMATTITRLTEAEEKRWREMLAKAWEEGYAVSERGGDCPAHEQRDWCPDATANPYRG